MRIRLIFWVCLSLVNCLSDVYGKVSEVDILAESAILVNAETGVVLYEKNPHARHFPASLTKIATAAYVLNIRGDKLDTPVQAQFDSLAWISDKVRRQSNYSQPAYWLETGSKTVGVKKGEILPLEDLLHGMVLASGDDAANVIARFIGGTIPQFMDILNEYLQDIGCTQTQFKNPHGLHHPNHYTTAHDMAHLTRIALRNPLFSEMVQKTQYTRGETNLQPPYTYIQTNRLLKRGKYYYPKAIGVKTGYTSIANHALVAAAASGNRTLIAVFLKCKDRDQMFQDAIRLFEAAFQEEKVKKMYVRKGKQNIAVSLPSFSKQIKTMTRSPLIYAYYPSEKPQVKCVVTWEKLVPPLKHYDRVGEIALQTETGKTLKAVPLYAQEEVKESWKYWLRQRKGGKMWILLGSVALLIGGVFWCLSPQRRK